MFATNAKNSFLGRLGSSLGDLTLSLPPSYDNYIRSHPSIANYWPLFNKKASAVGETDVIGGVVGTYAGTPTDSTTFIAEGGTTFPSGGRMTTTAINIAHGAVEFWCNIPSNPVTGTNQGLLFGLVDSSVKFDKVVYLKSDGTISFEFQDSTPTTRTLNSLSALPLGRWNHIVVVQDTSSGVSLYINGILANNTFATVASRTDLATGGWLGGTGATLGFVDVPGSYSNLALYSGASALQSYDIANHYKVGSAGALAGARVTQAVVEVLRNSSTRAARVTQAVVEVLRSSSTNTVINVSAASSWNFGYTASKVRSAVAFAASSWNFGYTASGLLGHNYTVSAASSWNFGYTASKNRLAAAAASSAMLVSPSTVEHAAFKGSAGSSFNFGPTASSVGNRLVSATSAMLFTPSSFRDTGHSYIVSAASAFLIRPRTRQTWPGQVYSDSVSSLSLSPSVGRNVEAFASATTRVMFGMNFYSHTLHPLNPAGSSLFLNSVAVASLNALRPKSAAAGISFGVQADCFVNSVFSVYAASILGISGISSVDHLYIVYAGANAAIHISARSSEAADFKARAASSFAVSRAVKSGREIHVSAITSFNLSDGDDSNDFFYDAGISRFTLSVQATKAVGGKLAGSGLAISAFASATILFPWRPRPLTLPPGGGLPHS